MFALLNCDTFFYFHFRQYCTTKNIPLIELAEEIIFHDRADMKKQQELWDDGLHFSAEGYNRFGKLVYHAIKHEF